MDHAAGVLLEGKRFEPQEVLLLRDVNVDQAVSDAVGLEHVGVRSFADLALELLPHVRDVVSFLLDCHLLLEPELEALVVNESNRSGAVARVEKWVGAGLVSAPAYFA